MPIEIQCQSCHATARVPDSAAGKRGKCRSCGAIIQVPGGIQKICSACGIDVSQSPRTKDSQGNYFCEPCWNARSGEPASASEPVQPQQIDPADALNSLAQAISGPPLLPSASKNPRAGFTNLREIALRQRALNLAVLGLLSWIAVFILSAMFAQSIHGIFQSIIMSLAGTVFLAFYVGYLIFLFRLARCFYSTGTIVAVLIVAFVIPCLGLIAVLKVSGRATDILQQYGIKVGLLGASKADIPSA